ncbi:MAG: hypothetical protein WC976_06070 [Caldisericia bacterium]
MKVNVCDVCLKANKLTKATTVTSVKGMPELRLDLCAECRTKIPEKMKEYIKLCHSLMGVTMTDAEIIKIYGGRIKL